MDDISLKRWKLLLLPTVLKDCCMFFWLVIPLKGSKIVYTQLFSLLTSTFRQFWTRILRIDSTLSSDRLMTYNHKSKIKESHTATLFFSATSLFFPPSQYCVNCLWRPEKTLFVLLCHFFLLNLS